MEASGVRQQGLVLCQPIPWLLLPQQSHSRPGALLQVENSHRGLWRQHRYRYSRCLSSFSTGACFVWWWWMWQFLKPTKKQCPVRKKYQVIYKKQQCCSEFRECFVTCQVNSEINSLLFCLSPPGAAHVSLPGEWAAAREKNENHITQNDPVSLQINAMQNCSMWALTTAINNTQRHLISEGGNQMSLWAILSILWLCRVPRNVLFKRPVVF